MWVTLCLRNHRWYWNLFSESLQSLNLQVAAISSSHGLLDILKMGLTKVLLKNKNKPKSNILEMLSIVLLII